MSAAVSPEIRALLSGPEALLPSVAADLGNPPWDKAAQRILIVRLSPFADVAGSQAHLVLFSECRAALKQAFIDFAFLPDRRDRTILSEKGLPFYYGLASGMPPEDFDLIMLSNSFVLELVNIGRLFGPRLPSRASERARSEGRLPIVIMGGSNASAAGAVLLPGSVDEAESDCLVDGIFFGEGEAVQPEEPSSCDLPGLSRRCGGRSALAELAAALAGDPGLPRSSRLEAASHIRGFWPALSGKSVARSIARPHPAPLTSYPVFNSSEASTARLQISAGCHGMCSFCLEGWDRKPYREIPVDRVLDAARRLRASSGAETLELYSFNFNTHTSILELMFELGRIFKRVNLMSQRLDILGRHPVLFAAETAADKRSFTLGIEGVSCGMRSYYQKGLSDDDIDSCISLLVRSGVRELKLFFIISGFEGEEDFDEFAGLMSRFARAKEDNAPGLRILVSCGYLVRLPFTPLQYAPLVLEKKTLDFIARRLRSICESEGIEFRLATNYDEYFADQLLALGGRRLGPWIEGAASEGHVYDAGLPKDAVRSLETAARGSGLFEPAFLEEKSREWRPPLSFVEAPWDVLWNNYRRAAAREDRASCLGLVEGKPGTCSACGACDTEDDRARIIGHAIADVDEAMNAIVPRIARLVEAKRRLQSLTVIVELPRSLARADEAYRASWLTRFAASRAPQEFKGILEIKDALFGGMLDSYWGKAVYTLRGPDVERLKTASKKAGFEIAESLIEPRFIDIELRLPLRFNSSARSALDTWLKTEHIDIVERRSDSNRQALEASDKSARKRLFHRAELYVDKQTEPDEYVLRLTLGPKSRMRNLIALLPDTAERCSSVQILSWKCEKDSSATC